MGKPRSRPRAAPCTTSPRIRCGRPRTAAAVATSPSRKASRTQVEEQRRSSPPSSWMGKPSEPNSLMTSTSKPSFFPSSCMVCRSPELPRPKRASWPITTWLALEAADEDGGDEFLGSQAGEFERVLHHQHGVEAQLAEGGQLVLQPHDQFGADSGRCTCAGCGSKVMATARAWFRRADADELGEHLLVAAVHAVEVAERDNGRTEVRRDFGRIVPDVDHQPRLLLPAMSSSGERCRLRNSLRLPAINAGPGRPGRAAGARSLPRLLSGPDYDARAALSAAPFAVAVFRRCRRAHVAAEGVRHD